jgi:hypothetical protein
VTTDDRPFADLTSSGLLWLINASVFHPRGFALAVNVNGDGEATGWSLLGDGREPWTFGDQRNEKFAAAEATFRRVKAVGDEGEACTPHRAGD